MEARICNPSTWEVETERSDAQKHSEARSESCMYIPLLFLPYLSIPSLLFSYPLSFIPHHPSLLCFFFPCSSPLSFSSIFPLTPPSSLSLSFKSLPTSFQAKDPKHFQDCHYKLVSWSESQASCFSAYSKGQMLYRTGQWPTEKAGKLCSFFFPGTNCMHFK